MRMCIRQRSECGMDIMSSYNAVLVDKCSSGFHGPNESCFLTVCG